MAKFWFLDHLCRCVSKDKIRTMCVNMELSPLETRLILERFCDGKTLEQCDFLPPHPQKDLLPYLNAKVYGWFQSHINHFEPAEWEEVFYSMARARLRRIA